MRHARLITVAVLSLAIVSGCASASAGWTYMPAPSATPAPSGAPSAQPSGSGNPNLIQISALAFKYDPLTATAPANVSFQVSFANQDAGVPHNISLHLGDVNGAELFKGAIFNGVETRVYDVPPLDAGAYAFVCTVHPTMIGTLTVK
jgi:plastocyanin